MKAGLTDWQYVCHPTLDPSTGLRVSGPAAPGDGFRLSGAGMTEGRGRVERRDSFAQRGFAPTVYQLLERYALEGKRALQSAPPMIDTPPPSPLLSSACLA